MYTIAIHYYCSCRWNVCDAHVNYSFINKS